MHNLPLQTAAPAAQSTLWLSYVLIIALAIGALFLLGFILNKVYKRKDGISRPVFLSGLMAMAFIANLCGAIYAIMKYSAPIDLLTISLSLVNVIGTFFMVTWKRLGFYVVSAAIIVSAAALSIYNHSFSNLLPVVCVPVWYLLLQLKCSNGERCWKTMV